jgi:hypothetical protein
VLKFLHEQKEFGDSHKQKPKQMKAVNQFEQMQYTILLAEGTFTDKLIMSADRIFNSGKEQGDDFEFIYSLNERFEDVMKMNVGDSMSFKSNRDDQWVSVIVRIEDNI